MLDPGFRIPIPPGCRIPDAGFTARSGARYEMRDPPPGTGVERVEGVEGMDGEDRATLSFLVRDYWTRMRVGSGAIRYSRFDPPFTRNEAGATGGRATFDIVRGLVDQRTDCWVRAMSRVATSGRTPGESARRRNTRVSRAERVADG